MNDLPFLDTNIFVYAFASDERSPRAQELVARPYVASVQAFNEFAHVMRRKARRDWSEIRDGLAAIHETAARVMDLNLEPQGS